MCYGGMDFTHFQVISLETGRKTPDFLIISFTVLLRLKFYVNLSLHIYSLS